MTFSTSSEGPIIRSAGRRGRVEHRRPPIRRGPMEGWHGRNQGDAKRWEPNRFTIDPVTKAEASPRRTFRCTRPKYAIRLVGQASRRAVVARRFSAIRLLDTPPSVADVGVRTRSTATQALATSS